MDGAALFAVFTVGSAGEDSFLIYAICGFCAKIPKSPPAVGTFEKSCENLCFAVLLRPFAAVDVRPRLIPKLF